MYLYPATPDIRVRESLTRLCGHYGKTYCYPSGETLLRLIFQDSGRRMSKRNLWRHTGALERDGWIIRQRRHCTGPTGELELHSTLYILTEKTLALVRSLAAKVGKWCTETRNSLIHFAVTEVAQTLTSESYFYTKTAARGPPRR